MRQCNRFIIIVFCALLFTQCTKDDENDVNPDLTNNENSNHFVNDSYLNLTINDEFYHKNNLVSGDTIGQTGHGGYNLESDTARIGRDINFKINDSVKFVVNLQWLENKSLLDSNNYLEYRNIKDMFDKLRNIDYSQRFTYDNRTFPYFELNYRFPLKDKDVPHIYWQHTEAELIIDSLEIVDEYIKLIASFKGEIIAQFHEVVESDSGISYIHYPGYQDFIVEGNFKAWLSTKGYLY